MLRPGLAAGHPATVEAGIEILEEGGTAADAAVAASLASCVAETVMTGLLGGGHAIYLDGASGRAANLDCFVAVPGLGAEPREPELLHLDVPFGAELVHYAVGPASCGVPGLPAGLDALWREHGRLPWPRVVEPALRAARAGTLFPSAHAACLAMLAPVMTMNEGAALYSPGGELLGTDSILRQPGLVTALELVAEEGAGSVYRGSLAAALLELMVERGGLVTQADLDAYEATWSSPAEGRFLGWRVETRRGLSGFPATFERFRGAGAGGGGERARVLAILDALGETTAPTNGGDTTNLVAADDQGSVCVLTTSLGLGSGDFLPGLDLHLNSMLGEADLVRGPLEPGTRMGSMMAPTLVHDADGITVGAGAAGGTRLRTALLTVLADVLDGGASSEEAVSRPRFHPAGGQLANAEPGLADEALDALRSRSLEVRVWEGRHHYFGGVSLITRSGGAGDLRRNGAAAAPAGSPGAGAR
jgi:gamma-glutamyltranspeptidase/glutathione hydrolase